MKGAETFPENKTLTLQQALDLAVQHHTAGRLTEARSIYQQILRADPNHPISMHLLGVIAHQEGQNATAVDLITKALAIKPDYADAQNNDGTALQEPGRSKDAVAQSHAPVMLNTGIARCHD